MLAAEGDQVFMKAAVALDAQEAVFQQAALQVIFELLADEPWQMTARALDLLHEARVMFSNDGIERGLFGLMPVIGRRDGNRVRNKHRPRMKESFQSWFGIPSSLYAANLLESR